MKWMSPMAACVGPLLLRWGNGRAGRRRTAPVEAVLSAGEQLRSFREAKSIVCIRR